MKIKKIKKIRGLILQTGAVLIFLSGIVSIVVSIPIKAVYNGSRSKWIIWTYWNSKWYSCHGNRSISILVESTRL